jgi:hypothetical protein
MNLQCLNVLDLIPDVTHTMRQQMGNEDRVAHAECCCSVAAVAQ